jgi:PAS domain S-box-containing protein
MRQQGFLFRQFVWMAVLVAAPLLVLLGYEIRQVATQARASAYQAVETDAASIAQDAESLLRSTEQYLTFLAQRPLVMAMDPVHCDPILDGVVLRREYFANATMTDLAGRPICMAAGGPGSGPKYSFASSAWFQRAAASNSVSLSKAFLAPLTQKTVVAMSVPLHDASRQRTGTLSVFLDVESIQHTWDHYTLPAGSRLTLVDAEGTILTSRPDFGIYAGKNAAKVIQSALASNPKGVGVAPGFDGVERVFAIKSIEGWPWRSTASVPSDYVFASYRAQLHRSLIAGTLVLVAVLSIAILMARRMAAPLASLGRTARAVAQGRRDARADESLPGEFFQVARELNAMLDAGQASEAELRESERRYSDLLANVEMIALMLDCAGTVTGCNDYLLALTGWSRGEMIGKNWLAEFLPLDRSDLADMFTDIVGGGELPRQVENEILTRSGERRLVRWHNSLLKSASGEIVGTASLGEDITEAHQARLREKRHMDFYAALFRTNAAIVRMSDPAAMYAEICQICVEHGHASIAYISLVDAGHVVPVAWAGPAEGFVRGIEVPLDPGVPEGRGPTAQAVRSGTRTISNRFTEDPSTLPWRDSALAIGTKSVAALPFRRAGKVVGTLSLHMTVEGFFDARLIELLEEMTGDVSFALDNFDRECDRAASVRQAAADYERFRLIFLTAPAAMTIAGAADHVLLDANDTCAAFTGMSRQELIGRDAFDAGLWPGDEKRAAFVEQLETSQPVRNVELTRLNGAGKRRDYLLQADLIEFDGQACVLTVATDITELRAAQRDLSERQRQLSGLVETAMDAIISVDADQNVRLFNRAAAEMFQVAASDALGSGLERFIPTRLHAVHREHLQAFAQTGSAARRMGAVSDLVGVRASGDEFPIEASISKLGEGRSVLMTVVIRDATEMRRAEQSRLAQLAAESASRAKTEFVSRMSHELRTPLNAVLGFSQMLQTHPTERLSENQKAQVEFIRQAGWHLLSLIDDVLDMSRIEAGGIHVDEISVDLVQVLDEGLRLGANLAETRDIDVEPAYQSGARVRVWGDPDRLRQVVINLLSNAVKYNKPGGSIRVEVLAGEDETHIDVIDTGLGMTALQLEHVYEPFNRLGRERSGVDGTGLGLALTQQLIQLMGGRIEIESQADRGTRVRVTLRTHAEAAESGLHALPNPAAAEVSVNDDPHGVVLYVEDNPVNLILVQQLLLRWPRVILLQAETGEAGLALARSAKPDLVLLDMRLPDMDGIAVLAALQGDESTHGLRVVALSASAMPDEVSAARKAGAFDYWTKPLDFEHFQREMKRLLDEQSDR